MFDTDSVWPLTDGRVCFRSQSGSGGSVEPEPPDTWRARRTGKFAVCPAGFPKRAIGGAEGWEPGDRLTTWPLGGSIPPGSTYTADTMYYAHTAHTSMTKWAEWSNWVSASAETFSVPILINRHHKVSVPSSVATVK